VNELREPVEELDFDDPITLGRVRNPKAPQGRSASSYCVAQAARRSSTPARVQKLQGLDNIYRVRVGDYCIIYAISGPELLATSCRWEIGKTYTVSARAP
jgi:hypothetical protein